MKISTITLFFFLSLIGFNNLFCQEEYKPSYDLEFIKAQYIDSSEPTEIVLFFHYSTKKKEDFKLIASTKFSFKIGEEGEDRTIIIGETKEHHSLEIYGSDMKEKSTQLYDIIKDNVDFNDKQEFLILAFILRGVTDEYKSNMTFTYGLWELPNNEKKRIERKYEISIDK